LSQSLAGAAPSPRCLRSVIIRWGSWLTGFDLSKLKDLTKSDRSSFYEALADVFRLAVQEALSCPYCRPSP